MTSCTEAHRAARCGNARRGREGGQVLALLLMLWAALLGGLLLVFNSGQLVAAKVRLVGAADAAAYSAAMWQARALNYEAYMNRGIVANEVAIAQLVSLRSWSAYLDQAAQEAAAVSSAVPPLAGPMRALAHGWSAIDEGLQRALPAFEAAASHWNVEVLSRAQYLADQQAPAVAASLATDVAIANLPEVARDSSGNVLAFGNARQWRNLTEGHSRTGEQRLRLREVVMESRDGFTQSRGWTFGLPPLASVKKRGGTELQGYDAWSALDTAAVHVSALFTSTEHPLAWGAAQDRARPARFDGDFGGSYSANPRTSAIAAGGARTANGYAGLPAYRDVRAGAGAQPRLRYELELRQPAASIQTSDVVMNGAATYVPGEEPKVATPALHSASAFALSAAQVWFSRPVGRVDQRQELANLFNPYWQARLAPTTHGQRALADAARGGPPDPYLVLP